jgi:hypothetical protein
MRNVAGNNTITGFVSLNTPSAASTSDSVYIESVAGKLTITGSISNDRPNTTSNLFLKGAGAIDLGGTDGIYASFDTTTSILNVDKSGNGTVTILLARRTATRGRRRYMEVHSSLMALIILLLLRWPVPLPYCAFATTWLGPLNASHRTTRRME